MARRATDRTDITVGWRCDSINIRTIDTSIRVNFSVPLSNDRYAVFLNPSLNLVVSDVNKDARGFTINVSVALSGDIEWLAIPYN